MSYITRSKWGARAARSGPGFLDTRKVEGIALHWPGDKVKRTTVEAVTSALRAWQAQHQDVNGWSDIAYQEAIDQAGNVYRLRGLRTQSGANGDTDVNQRFGAILLVLAIGEQPSEAMLTSARRRIARHRDKFPRSTKIVPHSAIRPAGTQCPGDEVRALIEAGAFTPRKVLTK